jgi:ABC-type Zn uptake system ZnuABC Zn-binding protein ZnuA
VACLAQKVGGPAVSVTTLTKPGAEPHDLELTPRQIADVGQAKFAVYVKGVQPAVDEAVEQHAKDKSLDATAGLAAADSANAAGYKQISIAGIDPSNEPSPARLAERAREIKAAGATTVFTETLVKPKVAQTLANEAGVRTAVLDPVEGVKDGSTDVYMSIMKKNLDALRPALVCS